MIFTFVAVLAESPLAFVILASALVFAMLEGLIFHEFCHAWAAWRLGDSTARWQGRITLDPRAHFDPVGGLMLVITAGTAGEMFSLYVGIAQIPMYFAPLLLTPLLRASRA